jgi:hypothetical protein
MKCLYDVLEVDQHVDDATLKKQYRKLALKWHPGAIHGFGDFLVALLSLWRPQSSLKSGHMLRRLLQSFQRYNESTVFSLQS